MNCGDLVLVSFTFTDQSSHKVRPALVVSRDEVNTGEDFVVVPLSSRISEQPDWSVVIDERSEAFAATGLLGSSAVRWPGSSSLP